jgi:hypothetical protein
MWSSLSGTLSGKVASVRTAAASLLHQVDNVLEETMFERSNTLQDEDSKHGPENELEVPSPLQCVFCDGVRTRRHDAPRNRLRCLQRLDCVVWLC